MKSVVDLSGAWHVVLDTDLTLNAVTCTSSQDVASIQLPASLDEAGLGVETPLVRSMQGLSRLKKYVGTAWYFKTVNVPPIDDITQVSVFLERCHWASTLFINGEPVGSCDSLSTPHIYDITRYFKAGEIQIVVQINNAVDLNIGRRGHMITDWTQTNWNGIIGRMEMQIHTGVNVLLKSASFLASGSAVQVTGDVTRYPLEGTVEVAIKGFQPRKIPVQRVDGGGGTFSAAVSIDGPVAGWCEWSPTLYEVSVNAGPPGDEGTLITGASWLSAPDKHLHLNGSRLYLRGTLECGVFPLTGHPPMDIPSWRRIMAAVKAHGLNHIRFHSWCPPDAAFVAADEEGILLQPELPLWVTRCSFAEDDAVMIWATDECRRIYATYNHHPSFGLFCLGNELVYRTEEPQVEALLAELKELRGGRLVTSGAYSHPTSPQDQYVITCDSGGNSRDSHPLRASSWWELTSRFDREIPSSVTNYTVAMDSFDQPVVAHEVGQWVVFPDVHNRTDYSGVLAAHNFEWIAEMLEQRGMLGLAPCFTNSSAKLSALLYKEEVEALLRTPAVSGFQLLGLNDFPGQGTATIGVLDAMWRSKGAITSNEFSAFCRSDVPLAQLPCYIYAAGSRITGKCSFAHYGPLRDRPVTLTAKLSTSEGVVIFEQNCGSQNLTVRGLAVFDDLNLFLPTDLPPLRAQLALAVDNDPPNTWDIWIYPPLSEPVSLREVLVTDTWDYGVANALRQGACVWLRHGRGKPANGVDGQFSSCFWSPVHFKGQAGTTGLLIQHTHPVFSQFPTEAHSQWQWWDVVTHSRSLVINDLPREYCPIVQTIDRFTRNDKLAVMLEAQVGKGRIFISCIDFDTDMDLRPASRQLEQSIRTYLTSPDFAPYSKLTVEELDTLYLTED